jgi:FkbM family methyltransferase
MNIVRYMLLRLKTLRGMTVVHVGAHFGQEASRYQNMMAAKVVWIEASPDTFQILQANIERAKLKKRNWFTGLFSSQKTEHICINALISDNDQDRTDFYVYENDGAANSIFKIDRSNKEYEAVRETGEVLSLPVKTLDRALADAGVPPEKVDVLVLDTQGAELMCLKGAAKLLSSAKYIETEVSTEPVYAGGVLLSELEKWLQNRGFTRNTVVRRSHMNVIFRKAG